MYTCNSNTGEMETGRSLGLTGQPVLMNSRSVQDTVSKNKMNGIRRCVCVGVCVYTHTHTKNQIDQTNEKQKGNYNEKWTHCLKHTHTHVHTCGVYY